MEVLLTYFFFPLIVALCIFYYWTAGRDVARKFNKIPGPYIFPFIGGLHVCLRAEDLKITLDRIANEWGIGKSFRFWLAHKPYLVTWDYKVNEKILANPIHVEKADAYVSTHFLLGKDGILNSKSDIWRKDRKMMVPSLKTSLFPGFLAVFNKHGKIFAEILKNREIVNEDMHKYFARLALDVTFETMLDMPVNIQKDENGRKFYEAFTYCFHLIRGKTYEPWLRNPLIWRLFGYEKKEKRVMADIRTYVNEQQIAGKLLEWRQKYATEEFVGDKKFAHIMYEKKDDPENIFYHMMTMIGAGYDTTATALNHTVYLLALNPEVQKKTQEELDSVFHGDFESDATFEQLSELKYCELVLKESMRLFVPAPLLARELGEDLELGEGKVVPKGCNVAISTWHTHHDPDVWKNPMEFIPERFLPENSVGRSPYSYVAFSGGPRGCMGPRYAMPEMKLFLAKVLGNFNIETTKPMEGLVYIFEMGVHVVGGLPVTLTPRHKNVRVDQNLADSA